MIWSILVVILAGWGLISSLWIFLGYKFLRLPFLSPVIICRARELESCIQYGNWLKNLGIFRGDLRFCTDDLSDTALDIYRRKYPETEICSLEQLFQAGNGANYID